MCFQPKLINLNNKISIQVFYKIKFFILQNVKNFELHFWNLNNISLKLNHKLFASKFSSFKKPTLEIQRN